MNITMLEIQKEENPVRRAALLHCRFFRSRAWEAACDMRDALIDAHDPVWPHDEFWGQVDAVLEKG